MEVSSQLNARPLYHRSKDPVVPTEGGCVAPMSRSGRGGEEKIPIITLPGI
jgi:hypothetical protein